MTNTDDQDAGRLLEEMIVTDSPAQIRESLREIQKKKKLATVAKDPKFSSLAQKLASLARQSEDEVQRIAAVVVLSRIKAALRLRSGVVVEGLKAALTIVPPPLSLIEDPDDRVAVARALDDVKGNWLTEYVASAMVAEESAENTREELGYVLLKAVPLAVGIRALAMAFKTTGSQGASVVAARKLRRVLGALRKGLPRIENESGPDLGVALSALFGAAFQSSNVPWDRKALEGLAEELLAFLHDVLRAYPVGLTDPELFSSLAVPQSWFGAGLWRNWVQDSPAAKALLRDLSSGIILLGKQGLIEDKLREKFFDLAGGSDPGQSELRVLGERHPELPGEIRSWLERGSRTENVPNSSSFEESSLARADHQLARALLVAARLESLLNSGDSSDSFRTQAESLGHEVFRTATSRGLRVVGSVGDVVQFSPHAHELATKGSRAAAKVRVVRPLVERKNAAGYSEVLVRAVVEPADSD